MAISTSPVNQATTTVGSGSSSFNVTISAPTNGNFLALLFWYVNLNSAISSISQTGASWARAVSQTTVHTCEIWYAMNASSASTTVSVTLTANTTSSSCGANVTEWSGVATSGALDAAGTSATSGGPDTNPLTPSVTPTSSKNALILGLIRPTGAITAGPTGGFTALTSPDGGSREFGGYQVAASTSGSYQAGWTQGSSATWASAIATFLAPGGGGGGRTFFMQPGLDGTSIAGPGQFNPSLGFHRHPTISLSAYLRERERQHRAFLRQVQREQRAA